MALITVIMRVAVMSGTAPLIITISQILSRITSIRAFKAKLARPSDSQMTGVRINRRTGLMTRFKAVNASATRASSDRPVGTLNPETSDPAA